MIDVKYLYFYFLNDNVYIASDVFSIYIYMSTKFVE